MSPQPIVFHRAHAVFIAPLIHAFNTVHCDRKSRKLNKGSTRDDVTIQEKDATPYRSGGELRRVEME